MATSHTRLNQKTNISITIIDIEDSGLSLPSKKTLKKGKEEEEKKNLKPSDNATNKLNN